MTWRTLFGTARVPARPRTVGVAALALGTVLAVAPSAVAAPGDLDPGFGGGDGRVTTDFGAHPAEPEIGNTVARDSATGELFVLGRRGINIPLTGLNNSFGLVKYTADGVLDTSFGDGGTVATTFGDNVAAGRALLLDGDKIIAGGLTRQELIADLALARYNADGSLDTSFGGGDGKATFDLTNGLGDGIRGLAFDRHGKILATGAAGTDTFVARFTSDGRLDTSFGGGDGFTVTDFGPGDHGFALRELRDGALIVGGNADNDFLLARYRSDGSLDTGFGGGDGHVTTDFSGLADLAFGLTIDPRGRFLLAGAVDAADPFGGVGPIKVGLARYHADGSLDSGFDGDGRLTTDVDAATADEARDVAIDARGRIVVVGLRGEVVPFPSDPTAGDALAIRYHADGRLDTAFGGDGIVSVDFAGGADAARKLILVDGRDLILAGGATSPTTGLDFAAIRLKG